MKKNPNGRGSARAVQFSLWMAFNINKPLNNPNYVGKFAIYGAHPSINTTASPGAEKIRKETEKETTGRKLRRDSSVIDLSQEQAGEFLRLQTMETQLVTNTSILRAEDNPLVGPDNSSSTSRAAKIPDKSDVARKSTEDESSFRGQIPSLPSAIDEG